MRGAVLPPHTYCRMTTTPVRGKTTAKSTPTSYAPKGQTPGDLTLAPDSPAPARDLIQLSSDFGVNKMRPTARKGGEPSEIDLDKRLELRMVLRDLNHDLGAKLDGSPRQLIARYGRVIGVQPDVVGSTAGHFPIPGWRYQADYGMLMPARNTAAGREWHARLNDLGVLGEHVDGSAGPGGGTGSISYTVQPID